MMLGCLRLSDVSVICFVTYLRFAIQACFSSTSISQAAQAVRYDTIRRDGQLNLAYGSAMKKIRGKYNQKPSSSEETVQVKVRGGSPGGNK